MKKSKLNILKKIEKHIFEIFTVLFWIWLIFLYFYFRRFYTLSNEKILKIIYSFIKSEMLFGGLIYIIIYVLRTIVFFPSSLILILSPSLFGLPLAIVYTIIWENLSATLGYFLWKFFWKNILSDSWLSRFDSLKKKLKEDSFLAILSARLLFVPFDPLSYVSWFFNAEFRWYLLWTFFGTLPSILIIAFAWAWIKNIEKFDLSHIRINHEYMIFSVAMTIFSLLIVYLLKKNKHKKTTN